MIRVGVLGAHGRMGNRLTRLLQEEYASKALLVASVGRGQDAAPLLGCDVIIDFSSPSATLAAASQLIPKNPNCCWVVGCTGWASASQNELGQWATKAPILQSSNFSTGVLALREILSLAGPLLDRLGYQPVLIESHHQHKKDSPSGTAILLRQAVRPSAPESIQTHSIRAGEIVGDHEIRFQGPADHLTLGHFAQDRSIFARGALEVALWLVQNKDRLASRKQILGVEEFFRDKFLAQA